MEHKKREYEITSEESSKEEENKRDSSEDKEKGEGKELRNIANFSEEELEKRWSELRDKDDWDEECEKCERPIMLHIEPCERKTEVGDNEYREICREWRWFTQKMKLIRTKKEVNGDDEDAVEIEEIEDAVGIMVHDLPN